MDKKILYVEGKAGAGGDMILAALHDLGFPLAELKKTLRALNAKLDVKILNVKRKGIRAKQLQPILPKKGNDKLLKLSDFTEVIEKSRLPMTVKEPAIQILKRLGNAESRVHQKPANALRFHELGGWDTLFDIVGVVAGIAYLDISEIKVGALNLGSGVVSSAHGLWPVPGPAVTELTKGFLVYSSGLEGELLTPTGAAILTTLGAPAKEMPAMTLESVGHGAGRHDFEFPNVLRLFMGKIQWSFPRDQILKLESNLDDMNPQYWESAFEKLYASGALEVFITPVIMKKGRPAQILTVLAPLEKEDELTGIIFEETTTLGIRRELISRTLLHRKTVTASTPFGKIPFKVGYWDGKTFNIHPEYDALKRVAKKHNISLKKLYDIANTFMRKMDLSLI